MHHDEALSKKKILPSTIIVCWINHSHFEPLAQIISVGPRVAEIRIVFDPSKSEEDAKLVKQLMTTYATQCEL